MTGTHPRVTVHIERLLLEGIELGPGGGDHVRAGLAAELATAIRDRGLIPTLAGGGARPELAATEVRAGSRGSLPAAGAAQLGRRVGAGLGERLAGPGGRP